MLDSRYGILDSESLKQFLFKSIFSTPFFLASVAGILWAAAFPKMNVAGLAWIVPALILFAARNETAGKAFRIGFVAGLVQFSISLHWLLFIPFPSGAVSGWLALSLYCALFPAIWVWLSKQSEHSKVKIPKFFWSFTCAAIWVALEMIRARLLSGFPWNFIGVSQVKMLPLIQIASITGVHGVSFVVVWFSISLFCSAQILIATPMQRQLWLRPIIFPLLTVVIVCIWGFQKISSKQIARPELKVALVQPSIPQTLIFNPRENPKRFQHLLKLSEKALAEKPDVLIWPEATMPPFDEENVRVLKQLCVSNHVWLVIGADDAQLRETAANEKDFDYFNASFLINPNGEFVATYRKQRLVIFGEYIPFEQLPFMKLLTPIESGFTPGKSPVPFRLSEPRANFSVLICFEDAFPHFTSAYVEDDTDLLLNLTNDGWFGDSAAQWQHAFNAVFRSIENGIPLVRCTNNGLTCWIDEFGRLRKYFSDENGSIYGSGFLIAQIPLLNPGEKRTQTFYHEHGDWFGWSCVGIALISCVQMILSRRKTL